MDRQTGDKWLIHGPKPHKDYTPTKYPCWEWKQDTTEFHKNEFNPVICKKVRRFVMVSSGGIIINY